MSESVQYYADVDIYLECNGERIPVSACLGNRCTVVAPRDLTPCGVELVIKIDGIERRKKAFLRYGMSQDRRAVELDFSVSS